MILIINQAAITFLVWLATGAAFGYWAGVVGARYAEPKDRSSIIGGGVVVGLLLGIFAVPLFYWFRVKPAEDEEVS
jgi:hypothetical protein